MVTELHYTGDLLEALENAAAAVVFAGPDAAGTGGSGASALPGALPDAIRRLGEAGLFKGEAGGVQTIPTLGTMQAGFVVLAGIGDGSPDSLRQAGAAAAKALKQIKAEQACALVGSEIFAGGGDGADASDAVRRKAQALAEGFLLGAATREPQRREKPAETKLRVTFAPDGQPDAKAEEAFRSGMDRGRMFGEAVAYARRLTNLPGNLLTPEMLALEAEALAREFELDIEVIDEWTATEMEMGGLLGVGQGSANPPRMIVLHYEGDPDSKEKLGLIGKGITFDTGGISLKRADGMDEMISDMAGAAAVLGAMRVIGEAKPKINVVAVIPAAENMPSGQALKPGDVLKTMSGRMVEVVNTDAEGRLVLADGLTTAIRRGATRLIDVATLTGAVMVALGDVATGAVTNDEAFLAELVEASRATGERIWQLPSWPEYRKLLESDAADLKNSGGRHAGTITGGLFIGEFAEGLPWIHLDIGGTAWLFKERGWEPKGATGVMTRTLAEYALRLAERRTKA
ncbi:MAG: peptidase M17 [Thermobacillus sp. ZCTH02-B1]|uniref:leucyl aminopeptidase n=1 Tax=Thermobacillus sp. ZCTH02-B1 TaxID=1858795 RepID=UPI000B54D857|nr:leucyl aminopeptidase [Thermobacillus sp. ZCTH02-B1]OUM95358.1 MAG: peptidase M17 [Thermobacillus sp. ZCTH02-B1]